MCFIGELKIWIQVLKSFEIYFAEWCSKNKTPCTV